MFLNSLFFHWSLATSEKKHRYTNVKELFSFMVGTHDLFVYYQTPLFFITTLN